MTLAILTAPKQLAVKHLSHEYNKHTWTLQLFGGFTKFFNDKSNRLLLFINYFYLNIELKDLKRNRICKRIFGIIVYADEV